MFLVVAHDPTEKHGDHDVHMLVESPRAPEMLLQPHGPAKFRTAWSLVLNELLPDPEWTVDNVVEGMRREGWQIFVMAPTMVAY